MKIAVIGAGISGLSCAWKLAQAGRDVTLFEAGSYFGGHSHTVDVRLDGRRHGVDTGFLVFNERTYPELIKLFQQLDVEAVDSDMSFSVKMPDGARTLEWAGANLDTVFCQRRNLLSPAFLRMLADIMRFNRQAGALAVAGTAPALSLGDYLDRHQYGAAFRNWYLLPMAACIWSCPSEQMLAFPLATFIRFCHNHGLLQVSQRPQWRTVKGGSRVYVEKLLAGIPQRRLACPVRAVSRHAAGVAIDSAAGREHFDQVVLACHSDQALVLLAAGRNSNHALLAAGRNSDHALLAAGRNSDHSLLADGDERSLLAAIRYQPNRAVLHTDASCLPQQRKAWSAWNYQGGAGADASRVCVHYLINQLQPLPFKRPVIVSLNPVEEPDPACVIDEFAYAHPVFDAAAIAAQGRLAQLQGRRRTWFAGAWTGYGFHEDGLKSGLAVADALLRTATLQHAA